jgi:ADP-ribosylglycohydrolase
MTGEQGLVFDGHHRLRQVKSSMLWAAWADALGFISELTDAAGLRRRLGHDGELKEPVAWKRRVGGKFGVTMSLPAGCYSDDTQLRLATARALSRKGFDAEAFTAVELTLWPAYALGGGRASKAAAAGFAKPNTPWFANFFDGWVDAGGNGAAMRIQPHVWAATRLDGDIGYLQDVLLNAITTHGHPRALVGAVLHAYALGQTMVEGQVVRPDDWLDLLEGAGAALSMLESHEMIASVWIPAWEEATGSSFKGAWAKTMDETRRMLNVAGNHVDSLADDQTPHGEAYAAMCRQLGLFDAATRGSGTTTVVAALALAAAHLVDPRQCVLVACRALGTDTDTIGCMAGAMVGAAAAEAPPTPVQDYDYLCAQAERLVALSDNGEVSPTRYPDLLMWQPPRSQLDAVGLVDGRRALAGLALLTPLAEGETASNRGAQWQWFRSDLGPTFLLKHREPEHLQELPPGNRPLRGTNHAASFQPGPSGARNEQLSFIDEVPSQAPNSVNDRVLAESGVKLRGTEEIHTRNHTTSGPREREAPVKVDVDQMLEWLVRQGHSDHSIGYAVRRMARLGTLEQLIALTTALRDVIVSSSSRSSDGSS